MNLWDARALAAEVDRLTIPQCKVVKTGNWRFTENEWLAINEIPTEAVVRLWDVSSFEMALVAAPAVSWDVSQATWNWNGQVPYYYDSQGMLVGMPAQPAQQFVPTSHSGFLNTPYYTY